MKAKNQVTCILGYFFCCCHQISGKSNRRQGYVLAHGLKNTVHHDSKNMVTKMELSLKVTTCDWPCPNRKYKGLDKNEDRRAYQSRRSAPTDLSHPNPN